MTQMGDGRWQISRRHGAGTLRIAPTAHDEIAQTTGLGMTKNGTGGLQARFHVMESRRVGCFTRRHEGGRLVAAGALVGLWADGVDAVDGVGAGGGGGISRHHPTSKSIPHAAGRKINSPPALLIEEVGRWVFDLAGGLRSMPWPVCRSGWRWRGRDPGGLPGGRHRLAPGWPGLSGGCVRRTGAGICVRPRASPTPCRGFPPG